MAIRMSADDHGLTIYPREENAPAPSVETDRPTPKPCPCFRCRLNDSPLETLDEDEWRLLL